MYNENLTTSKVNLLESRVNLGAIEEEKQSSSGGEFVEPLVEAPTGGIYARKEKVERKVFRRKNRKYRKKWDFLDVLKAERICKAIYEPPVITEKVKWNSSNMAKMFGEIDED